MASCTAGRMASVELSEVVAVHLPHSTVKRDQNYELYVVATSTMHTLSTHLYEKMIDNIDHIL